jgi:hypothetical protein
MKEISTRSGTKEFVLLHGEANRLNCCQSQNIMTVRPAVDRNGHSMRTFVEHNKCSQSFSRNFGGE